MDEVFKALADPTRRSLLDELFKQDGQALGALGQRLTKRSNVPTFQRSNLPLGQGPAMTRFGVMKHLRVLEEARLVTTKRRGREKLHFLNPVPIRLIHDRWITKYAEHRVAALANLKTKLEESA